MVFCVQMGPKPLSQSIPQASWGGRGQRTEFGVWPPCPHISPSPPFKSSPGASTYCLPHLTAPTKVWTVQQRQGPRTLPGENLT